jgi:formate dehydrogenase subunit gamma
MARKTGSILEHLRYNVPVTNEDRAVEQALAACADLDGALLPVLHAIQDAIGWVPDSAVPVIARALNISRADVVGTISFYHDFRRSPPGRTVVKLCRAEACQAVGAGALEQHVKAKLDCDFHQTARGVTLEPAYCLGNCAVGPSALIDGALVGRVTPARFDALVPLGAATERGK